jgi:hypothetical protein
MLRRAEEADRMVTITMSEEDVGTAESFHLPVRSFPMQAARSRAFGFEQR